MFSRGILSQTGPWPLASLVKSHPSTKPTSPRESTQNRSLIISPIIPWEMEMAAESLLSSPNLNLRGVKWFSRGKRPFKLRKRESHFRQRRCRSSCWLHSQPAWSSTRVWLSKMSQSLRSLRCLKFTIKISLKSSHSLTFSTCPWKLFWRCFSWWAKGERLRCWSWSTLFGSFTTFLNSMSLTSLTKERSQIKRDFQMTSIKTLYLPCSKEELVWNKRTTPSASNTIESRQEHKLFYTSACKRSSTP